MVAPWLLAALVVSDTQDPLLDVPPLPEATASYDLKAELDPETKRITAEGTIRWVHRGEAGVDELWWHLYLNAFRNQASTFMRETGGRLRGDEMISDDWGWIEVTRLEARGADLLAEASFETPDDDNADDRTVLRTPLGFVLEPGETLEIEVAFTSQLPRVFARTGYGGSFFMVAQWFPKLGVLLDSYRPRPDAPRWNAHQFHGSSEFFADFGDYRVAITVPDDHVVGATGSAVERRHEDGKTTVTYVQKGVHDFAWTADPRFVEQIHTFGPEDVPAEDRATAAELLGLSPDDFHVPTVEVRLLLQPEHVVFAERYRKAVFASLQWFGLLYGFYPYPTLTLVDGPRQAHGAMGMEYPTLIAGGVSWPQPEGSISPELVTVHEFGHQYWYGLVATNEFEEAWLDEGFNTYSTGEVLDRVYGPLLVVPKLLGVPLTPWFFNQKVSQESFFAVRLLRDPDSDPIAQPAWHYRTDRSYGVNSYPRPALFLRQVEALLGPSTFARAMRTYALRWRYRHPTTEDFLQTLDDATGRPISDLLRPLLREPGALDYAVVELESKPKLKREGVYERTDPDDPTAHRVVESSEDDASDPTSYTTTVELERKGEARWPVTVEVRFEDGSVRRRSWSGAARWKRFEFETPAKAASARIHPDGEVPLDLRRINDSRRIEPDPSPGWVWGAHTTHAMQVLLQVLGAAL